MALQNPQRRLFGKDTGNFRFDPDNRRPFYYSMLGIQKEIPEVSNFFSPNCEFTNRIAEVGSEEVVKDSFLRKTRQPADGGIVMSVNHAVAIFNADCPVTAVFDPIHERLAVLHSGFRCLVREDPSELSIIDVLFKRHNFVPDFVKAFIGFGIGPCCFGAEHLPEVSGMTMPLPLSRAIRGPGKGQVSIDLIQLAKGQLIKLGVLPELITMDRTCTACDGGKYYSNYYEGWQKGQDPSSVGRNAALVWFA